MGWAKHSCPLPSAAGRCHRPGWVSNDILGLTGSHGAAWGLYLEICAGLHQKPSTLAMVSQVDSGTARGFNACVWATYKNPWQLKPAFG